MPNFIEIQKDSYNWFIKEGLAEVFRDISPIEDHGGKLKLIFGDFRLCYEDIKYTIDECKERDATYSVPLRVDVSLEHIDEDGNKPLVTVNSVYMGDLPLMNDTGSFVINGAERVIVSQLVRSPGIYYDITKDKAGKPLFTSQVIPNRGAWLEYETDSNDVFYVRVDRTRKVPVTVFLRALGVGTNEEILEMFGPEPKLLATFEKDPSDSRERGLLELYKKIRPGEPLSVDSADSLLRGMLFDVRRYDLAKVGRYKFNKKLNFRFRLAEQVLAEDVIDQTTGEVLAEAGTVLTRNSAEALQDAAVPYVYVMQIFLYLCSQIVNLWHFLVYSTEKKRRLWTADWKRARSLYSVKSVVLLPVNLPSMTMCWITWRRRLSPLTSAWKRPFVL